MTTPWLWRYENDAIEVGHVLRRMGELYERAGQRAEAHRAWNDLLKLWRNAEGAAALEATEVRKLLGSAGSRGQSTWGIKGSEYLKEFA